jgi:hypothetical protein
MGRQAVTLDGLRLTTTFRESRRDAGHEALPRLPFFLFFMHTYTTQRQVRRAFWEANPNLSRRQVTDHSGKGKMYLADTRMAFVDYVDALSKSGQISEALAERVTL